MKSPLLTLAWTLVAGTSVAAPPDATFRYTPPADEERPVIVEATIAPQGSDFAMSLRFDKEPWGELCKNRCANATLFLDTDSNTATGLQLGHKLPETGADLAVIIQGARDYREGRSIPLLRVKVRQLTAESRSADEGEALADLDHARDPERVQLDENTVYLLIDATSPTLPSGRKVRVTYHPPAAKALQATIAGMLTGGSSSNVRIFRGGNRGWGKAREAGRPLPSSTPARPASGSSPAPAENDG